MGVEGLVTDRRHQCKVVITLSGVRQCFSLEVALEDLKLTSVPVPRAHLKPFFASSF